MEVQLGELTILRGIDRTGSESGRVFPISMATTRLGRAEDADIRIAERGVSRLHAEIALDAGCLVLRSKSRTNPTLVNGIPVLGQVKLQDGDEIQLADRVVLGLRLDRSQRSVRSSFSGSSPGLSRHMEEKIDLDRTIEEFNVMGTFLDVDVVASRAMKGGSAKAEHIIVSFERFRAFVGGICQELDGQVLNSNGDELMCFFESAECAVLAGSAILERLVDFNRDLNLLSRDFRFRLGAHTGTSLVDLDAGIAYSEVLDTAGHIQKQAEPDSLVISQATLEALSRPVSVTLVGELTGSGAPQVLYRVDGPVARRDFETVGKS
jgi:class 3 adenylate cyclase